ncbi:hypothetical protein LR48_Vigan08g084900 [Vigna angularis]|uniref:Uncharacterized protein n=1 Tax=Phaseolus angularis TaxID=3914 RepID=A0A0L9V4Y3_PHAAN|nr:hypothetical protein LR48_Vigan08g084900 [Vigna angularis]
MICVLSGGNDLTMTVWRWSDRQRSWEEDPKSTAQMQRSLFTASRRLSGRGNESTVKVQQRVGCPGLCAGFGHSEGTKTGITSGKSSVELLINISPCWALVELATVEVSYSSTPDCLEGQMIGLGDWPGGQPGDWPRWSAWCSTNLYHRSNDWPSDWP